MSIPGLQRFVMQRIAAWAVDFLLISNSNAILVSVNVLLLYRAFGTVGGVSRLPAGALFQAKVT